MRNELSILIPVYNTDCRELVATLSEQCKRLKTLKYEIIVLDDASDTPDYHRQSMEINRLPQCCYIINDENMGRAATRNKLASMAQFNWLLFIDGDMRVSKADFITSYLNHNTVSSLIYGGYEVIGEFPDNLRWVYEKKYWKKLHILQKTKHHIYQQFRSCNFLIAKDVFRSHPFNNTFIRYGYEDMLFAKELYNSGFVITISDNPVDFHKFESNESFIKKTEEGLRNLKANEQDLRHESLLLYLVIFLRYSYLDAFIKYIFHLKEKSWRQSLIMKKPNLYLFYMYKLGYYLSLT